MPPPSNSQFTKLDYKWVEPDYIYDEENIKKLKNILDIECYTDFEQNALLGIIHSVYQDKFSNRLTLVTSLEEITPFLSLDINKQLL